jgi:hypothetical protein
MLYHMVGHLNGVFNILMELESLHNHRFAGRCDCCGKNFNVQF